MRSFAATLRGIEPIPVEIEINISGGLPYFEIVGLPDNVLRESRTRVKSALLQAGFEFPFHSRVVLNLAPSQVRKSGSQFELGLAAQILAATGQIIALPGPALFLGELALDGRVKVGEHFEVLSLAAVNSGAAFLVVPMEAKVSDLPSEVKVVRIDHLHRMLEPEWWSSSPETVPDSGPFPLVSPEDSEKIQDRDGPDFAQLRVSAFWARRLLVAAAGRHSVLLFGPPGTGKTFFAEALRWLMRDAPEVRGVGFRATDAYFERQAGEVPWSAPHHTSTAMGLVGGGSPPQPGAVTRANGGILFLDELLEFQPQALDALREPLERGYVEIHRATSRVRFPARFWLIAATNLCRCGNLGNGLHACRCAPLARYQYQGRISGPLLDRFDLRLLSVPPVPGENTVLLKDLKQQVHDFWARSGEISAQDLTPEAERKLQEVSVSSVRRIKKLRIVSLTLARLEKSLFVSADHLQEAESLMQNFEDAERNVSLALRYAHSDHPNHLGLQEVARTPPAKKGPGKPAVGAKKRRL